MSWFRNAKVKTKIISSFIIVLTLMMVLFVIFVVLINKVSSENTHSINDTAVKQEMLLRASTDIMNMRRMTGMIHAFAGDEGRIDGYEADFFASYDATINYLEAFEKLTRDSTYLQEEKKITLTAETEEMKDLLYQYRTLLFEPNVVNAKIGDIDALSASNVRYGSLIMSVSEKIVELVEDTKEAQDIVLGDAEDATRNMIIIFVAMFAAIIAIGIVTSLYISGLISKPLVMLAGFMKKAGSTGEIVLPQEEEALLDRLARGGDEIGETLSGCSAFIRHVRNIAVELDRVANGDLTVEIEMLSEKDVMGQSLKHMTDSLNIMFSGINAASEHVTAGAEHLTESSDSLAQGAAAQSASIEELSSSVSEISNKTRTNAEMAGEAAKLADTIKGNAEKGSLQMDEMMSAVNEINEASQSISKVIKTIDDIAFQTNILALNAAVEAARAGQHGKGFAVVAEEVRNLAAKSAEAAKDTGDLIENSIEKANVGVRIAGETADSLTEIVSGINESNQLIVEIARSSEEQSLGVAQINGGIDQVSQVVQQNSATAEESAAASLEMSSQSGILKELIAQFRLKDNGRPNGSVFSQKEQTRKLFANSGDADGMYSESTGAFGKY